MLCIIYIFQLKSLVNSPSNKYAVYDVNTLDAASCVSGAGRYYQGQVNTTKGGLACQPWYSARPHNHTQPPPVFPEMRNASNFCRNGGGIESGPWCYTMDPLVRWQHCDINKCGNS